MSGEEVAVACATIVMSSFTILSLAYMYMKRLQSKDQAHSGRPLAPAVDDRLSRIEQAVDAIAIEVERMSEGQRFTTRLLADHMAEPPRIGAAGETATRSRDGS